MNIVNAKDFDSMNRKAASIIFTQVTLKPDSVLGLATGSTPLGIYQNLIELYRKGDLDFSSVRTVNLDEYYGLDKSSDQSYVYFMWENLFKFINIKPENVHIPNGANTDADAECRRYNQVIAELGGIDLQLLGIGHNGHIGFNEPSDHFEGGTHCVTLTASTIEANKRFFGDESQVPRKAITMGIKSIMSARRILLVASGVEKAEILCEALTGPITPKVPASILQLHGSVTVVADEEALSRMNA